MSDAQTEAREIEMLAWNCDEWPEWLHKMVDETNEVADRLDMSAEQAHAYAVLAALAAKDAELAAVHQRYVDANEARIDAEAALAEARKALNRLTAWLSDEYDDVPNIVSVSLAFDNGEEIVDMPLGDFRAARRALEAQGGENG